MNADWSDEKPTTRWSRNVRNFYKVEKWTRDNMKVDGLRAIISTKRETFLRR